MHGAALIKEARLRAGLTQAELARRLDVAQSHIARWESGRVVPSFDAVVAAIRACGLELSTRLFAFDDSNDGFIWQLLDLQPAARLERQVAAANALHHLRGDATAFDPIPVIARLVEAGVSFVVLGKLAGNLRGDPLVPTERELIIATERDSDEQRELRLALAALGAEPWPETSVGLHEIAFELRQHRDAERWAIPRLGTIVAVVTSPPPGTAGFDDIRRDATDEEIGPSTRASVASLPTLIRIADASPHQSDSSVLPTLRRAYELTRTYRPPHERPVRIPAGLEHLFVDHEPS